MASNREFNGEYTGRNLDHIGFPLGGIGAGMMCLTGTGALSHVSLRHHPEMDHEPPVFAAVSVRDVPNGARVLEGPVPDWKIFAQPGAGNGLKGRTYGLPRFDSARFAARMPFATASLEHPALPVRASIVGWSPFVPGDSDDSSLPVAALEYTLENRTDAPVELTFSFHVPNMLRMGEGRRSATPRDRGFVLSQEADPALPHAEGAFCVECDHPDTSTDCAWFRGGWFDTPTMLWKNVRSAEPVSQPPHKEGETGLGASLYVPVRIDAGRSQTLRVRMCWYVPVSDVIVCQAPADATCCGTADAAERPRYAPCYASRFNGIDAVAEYWRENYDALRADSAAFQDALYGSTLPPEVLEAVAANLTILKSPTVLRQSDGRLWGWEGCCDERGCCAGSCTHVWNYAQAVCHLFPDLERSLRETEFGEDQDERGHQNFRANLPIVPMATHQRHAAADGQLGGIMKFYRDWRICGDHDWLRRWWPRVKQSLHYCIETWDPDRTGTLVEPHHNTYDIEFWGPDGMCTSFYLGALVAATRMAAFVGDEAGTKYDELYRRGRAAMETDLFNGEYFIQQIRWQDLRAPDPTEADTLAGGTYSPEARSLLRQEGPKYQYGHGCLSDGVLGAWMARVCGLGDILDAEKLKSHLLSVYRHNFRRDLSDHANPQRPTYALGHESGLLLCSWPKGGELSLPFVYSNEVWTGIEYQVASHLVFMGCVREGIDIVRAVRSRYDGRVRNPFDEYECGHWYARAMASYGLLQAFAGARYDAVDEHLHFDPRPDDDFAAFFATADGFGHVGVRDGKAFSNAVRGTLKAPTV